MSNRRRWRRGICHHIWPCSGRGFWRSGGRRSSIALSTESNEAAVAHALAIYARHLTAGGAAAEPAARTACVLACLASGLFDAGLRLLTPQGLFVANASEVVAGDVTELGRVTVREEAGDSCLPSGLVSIRVVAAGVSPHVKQLERARRGI